jgi:hypothetical protein
MPDNDIDPSLKSLIGMGELVKIYKPRRSSKLSEVLSSLFFVVLGLSAVYYAWVRYSVSHRINGETILFIIVVVFAYITFNSLKNENSHWEDLAIVYQNGFAYSHRNTVSSFQWTEITAINAIATKLRGYGIIPLGMVREYWIEGKATKLRLADTLDQVDDLLKEIRKNALPYMFDRLKQELDSGKAMEFGLITIDKYGVRFGDKDYFWYDLFQAGVAKGRVHYVTKKNSTLAVSGIHVSIQYVTNIDVLLALSNDLIKQNN